MRHDTMGDAGRFWQASKDAWLEDAKARAKAYEELTWLAMNSSSPMVRRQAQSRLEHLGVRTVLNPDGPAVTDLTAGETA